MHHVGAVGNSLVGRVRLSRASPSPFSAARSEPLFQICGSSKPKNRKQEPSPFFGSRPQPLIRPKIYNKLKPEIRNLCIRRYPRFQAKKIQRRGVKDFDRPVMSLRAAFEPRGDNLNDFQNFYLKAKDRIWPGLSDTCLIHSTADLKHITPFFTRYTLKHIPHTLNPNPQILNPEFFQKS